MLARLSSSSLFLFRKEQLKGNDKLPQSYKPVVEKATENAAEPASTDDLIESAQPDPPPLPSQQAVLSISLFQSPDTLSRYSIVTRQEDTSSQTQVGHSCHALDI